MSDQDQSQRREEKSEADQTLLGVAPPRIDSSVETLQRAPVYVRSGTSAPDADPVPVSRTALPNSPLRAASADSTGTLPLVAPPGSGGFGERALHLARQRPVLWMVLTPVLVAAFVILLGRHGHTQSSTGPASAATAAESAPATVNQTPASIAELEAKPAESLTAQELLLVASAHSERQVAAASALRHKVEENPALGKDSALQSELLRLAGDPRTSRDALAAMAMLEPPASADLLYEAWTGTAQRSDTTDLARALLYSSDVRAKASPALAVALELRVAETCEQYKAALPSALKDGDRRSLHLLSKLNTKHGCGPKKNADCFTCLREPKDELLATISAVKSRHPPSYASE